MEGVNEEWLGVGSPRLLLRQLGPQHAAHQWIALVVCEWKDSKSPNPFDHRGLVASRSVGCNSGDGLVTALQLPPDVLGDHRGQNAMPSGRVCPRTSAAPRRDVIVHVYVRLLIEWKLLLRLCFKGVMLLGRLDMMTHVHPCAPCSALLI
mmetsp:Transcript_6343/g.15659  ORF Transcript_6343/g.15659 Transcript_6343/m.15659 type:complete len:150 (+) Transcript_6343:1475-1924(+)